LNNVLCVGIGLLLFCGWSFLLPRSVSAQQSKEAPGRACANQDLVGSWNMEAMVIAPSERVDPGNAWFFEHQRFVFYENGRVKHLTSNKPLQAADLAALRAKPATATWSLDERGWLTIQKQDVPQSERALCTYSLVGDATSDPRTPRPGDVILTYTRGGKPAVQKLLRKTD